MDLNLKLTPVFEKNHNAFIEKTRFIVNEGGTGSSKTYSLAQLFLIILVSGKGVVLTVCRKALPSLRATAMKDFFEIMKNNGIYNDARHNKSELIYKYKNNEIEFISVDEPQKVRSRKRDYLWMNEANEFTKEDFHQLNLRTRKQVFMD